MDGFICASVEHWAIYSWRYTLPLDRRRSFWLCGAGSDTVIVQIFIQISLSSNMLGIVSLPCSMYQIKFNINTLHCELVTYLLHFHTFSCLLNTQAEKWNKKFIFKGSHATHIWDTAYGDSFFSSTPRGWVHIFSVHVYLYFETHAQMDLFLLHLAALWSYGEDLGAFLALVVIFF